MNSAGRRRAETARGLGWESEAAVSERPQRWEFCVVRSAQPLALHEKLPEETVARWWDVQHSELERWA